MISLLGEESAVVEEPWLEQMMQDLNVNQIIFGIKGLSGGYDIEEMYRMYPVTEDITTYRRKITKEFRRKEFRDIFIAYCKQMRVVRELRKKVKYDNVEVRKIKVHCDALWLYFDALDKLVMALEIQPVMGEEFLKIKEETEDYLKREDTKKIREKLNEIHAYFSKNHFLLSIEKNRLYIQKKEPENEEKNVKTDAIEEVRGGFWEKTGLQELEENKEQSFLAKILMDFVKKEEPGLYDKMEELMKIEGKDCYFQLEEEAWFYLAFYRYITQFEENGYVFSLPEQGDKIELRDGFDLALAAKKLRSESGVVTNDFSLKNDEKFAVITGPNGGGKTTFARMTGIILYFSAMGLLVPARMAKIPFYSKILTHFSVEESEKSGKGKLMEELQRLAPIMENIQPDHFVILNELFTTAATKDAEQMGKRVMDMCMEKGTCGIYVTHIQGLARETSQIVSMIAELCADHKTRSFRVTRRMAREEEYEDSMIEKHHLLYEQIREVLANESGSV